MVKTKIIAILFVTGLALSTGIRPHGGEQTSTPATGAAAVETQSPPARYELPEIRRGSEEEEEKLSDFLYYVKDGLLRKIDMAAPLLAEEIIKGEKLKHKYFNTFVYPNENKTGNRFMVFYEWKVKHNPSFIVFDKLTGTFDARSFAKLDESYPFVSAVYPVDYSIGGDYIHRLFIVVYMYMNNNDNRRTAVVQYRKARETSEDGRIQNVIIKKQLADNVFSHYYNPYEMKLVWLKQPSGNTGTYELHLYDVVSGKEILNRSLPHQKGDEPIIRFWAYNHFLISFKQRGKVINKIYNINSDKPIAAYSQSNLFSYSLRHNSEEFHLLVSGTERKTGSLLLHHKEFDGAAANNKFIDRPVPPEIVRAVKYESGIEAVLFLVRGSTYYICLVKRVGQGYQPTLYKLYGNFKKVKGNLQAPVVPYWLGKSNGTLIFHSEGNVLVIRSMASGSTRGLAYVDKNEKLAFIPPS